MRKLIQNQGAVDDLFQISSFELEKTTNNRLESTFNKIFYHVLVLVFVFNACSEDAGLIQFFPEFFTVLKPLHSERIIIS